jgi:hypothetical protein
MLGLSAGFFCMFWVWFGLWCLTPLSTILVLLVGEIGVPGENHQPIASH